MEILLVFLIFIFFILLGWKMYHEKWYKLVAGNVFGDDDAFVERHHKVLGIIFAVVAFASLLLLWL